MEYLKIPKGDSRTVKLLSGFFERSGSYEGNPKLYYDFRVEVDGDEMVWSTTSQNKAEELNRIPLNSEVRIELMPLEGGKQTWVFHTNTTGTPAGTDPIKARLDKIGLMVKALQGDIKYIRAGIDALAGPQEGQKPPEDDDIPF